MGTRGGRIILWDVENARLPKGMGIGEAVQHIRTLTRCDDTCGNGEHLDLGFHIAYTQGVLTSQQLNTLEGMGVRTHTVLGKQAGKLHEAENKLGQVKRIQWTGLHPKLLQFPPQSSAGVVGNLPTPPKCTFTKPP